MTPHYPFTPTEPLPAGRLARMSATHETPAAVLWDMDGTLIDTEPIWLDTELAMLARFGLELTDEVRERMVGTGLRNGAALFQELGVPLTIDEIIAEWERGVIAGIRGTAPEWRPGAVELLASLGEAGIPSCLVTMSIRSIADTVVSMLPAGAFAGVVAGDEVAHEKPHPDPYLRGAAALGAPIEACLAIEDSRTGLAAAAASGAVTVGVPHLTDLADAGAHALWPTLAGVDAAELSARFAALRGAGAAAAGARA